MTCVLCGRTLREAKIDQFPLSAEAREMLRRHFGIDPNQALLVHGVCRPCLNLPAAERNELALSSLKDEPDMRRRDLILDALKKNRE